MSEAKEPRVTKHLIARSRTTIVLVAGAVAAWAVTVDRMRGMDAGPGTDLARALEIGRRPAQAPGDRG